MLYALSFFNKVITKAEKEELRNTYINIMEFVEYKSVIFTLYSVGFDISLKIHFLDINKDMH